MVEKKEFAVTFRKIKNNDQEEFLPLSVVEGTYNEKYETFDNNNV